MFISPQHFQVVHMAARHFTEIDWARANKTHVPLATLGRFFMDGLLPGATRRLVYLDGDTWITSDPSALIETTFPDGKFAAAEGMCFFCRHDFTAYGRFVRSYFRGLGIDGDKGYFNAGVFAVNRNTWRVIAAEALDFFKRSIDACKYHDESALNAVVGNRRLRLSPAWNFQTPYRYWNVEKNVNPAIYHLAQGHKPWTGPIEPWAELFPLYQKELSALSGLKLPVKSLAQSAIVAANAEARWQENKLTWLLPMRLRQRRTEISKILATSTLTRDAV